MLGCWELVVSPKWNFGSTWRPAQKEGRYSGDNWRQRDNRQTQNFSFNRHCFLENTRKRKTSNYENARMFLFFHWT